MNYEYYKIFYYVGKHKNITRAAADLFSSQPAVTRAIQNLEAELGCRLFVRTKNGVEFTHDGGKLYEYISAAHSQIVKGEEEISRSNSVENGTVYIAATVTALRCYLFDILDDFHLNKFPKVKFKINTGSTNNCINQLKSAIADLAFVSTPYSNTKELNVSVIKQFNDVLIGGSKFEELKDKVLPLEELRSYPVVGLRSHMQLRQFIDSYLSEKGLLVTPDIEVDSADLLVPMIRHNFGLGFVPYDMARKAIEKGEVFKIGIDRELPARQICIISDPHHPHTNASRELYRTVLNKTIT